MKKIVIIGGGFAGSYAARKLENDFEVTLVDNKDYFEFTPSILRTIVEPEHADKIQALHKEYLKKAKFVFGCVNKIEEKSVFVDNRKYDYDYLIISSGSYYKTPFKEHDIIRPNRSKELIDYHERLEKAKSVCIVGGGLVGVELAGEIIHKYPDKKIILFQNAKNLIPRNNKKSGEYAKKFLLKKGVELKLEKRFDKKDQKKYDLVFFCVGIEPNFNFGFKKEKFEINEFLQLKGHENVFFAGDVANLKEEKTAQNAENHAKVVVHNIKALENKRKLKKYSPSKRPYLISLGKKKAIFEYKNFVWAGLIPALMKDYVEKVHMKKLKRKH